MAFGRIPGPIGTVFPSDLKSVSPTHTRHAQPGPIGTLPPYIGILAPLNTSDWSFIYRTMKRKAGDKDGTFGERVAEACLRYRDYRYLQALQNSSNHGIDLIAQNPQGIVTYIEVKTSRVDKPGKYSKDQKVTSHFIYTRLNQALNGEGHWKNLPPSDARDYIPNIADALLIHFKDPNSVWMSLGIQVYLDSTGKTVKSVVERAWNEEEAYKAYKEYMAKPGAEWHPFLDKNGSVRKDK